MNKKILDLDVLRISRNKNKICKCETFNYELDSVNRIVICKGCGAIIEPFEALITMASYFEQIEQAIRKKEQDIEKLNGIIDNLCKEAEKARKYKAKEEIIKCIEKQHKDNMAPYCPNCEKPFLLEKITGWRNRNYM